MFTQNSVQKRTKTGLWGQTGIPFDARSYEAYVLLQGEENTLTIHGELRFLETMHGVWVFVHVKGVPRYKQRGISKVDAICLELTGKSGAQSALHSLPCAKGQVCLCVLTDGYTLEDMIGGTCRLYLASSGKTAGGILAAKGEIRHK